MSQISASNNHMKMVSRVLKGLAITVLVILIHPFWKLKYARLKEHLGSVRCRPFVIELTYNNHLLSLFNSPA
jgi:hypothetical protein